MKGIFLLMIATCNVSTGIAQKEITNWFFGYGAGLNFSNNHPAFVPNGQTDSWEGCSSISDQQGNHLFYSDGIRVWDSSHKIMPNGTNLQGDTIATQSVQIVPFPGNQYLYYVFTVNAIETKAGELRYSIVDMRLNNGKGDITTEKNILLTAAACEKITAVKHANTNDVWIITHLFETNSFYVYRVSCKGIDPVPKLFSLGNLITGRVGNAIGYMKASPDGKKLAMASFLSVVEVFDFDNNSGVISNARQIGNNRSSCAPYGIEFSPDNRLLYVTEIYDCGAIGNYKILQYNLEKADITASMVTVESAWGAPPGALQSGPDHKIYIAFSNSSFLGVIAQPDVYGPGCMYIKEYIALPDPATSGIGLPSFVSGFNRTILGNNISLCEGTDTTLRIDLPNTSILWSTGSEQNFFQVRQSGNYYVSVTHDGCTYTDTINIEFRENPRLDLGPDKGICINQLPLVLEQNLEGALYQWQDGSENNSYSIDQAGLYWVDATLNGCSSRDSILVSVYNVPRVDLGKDTGFCQGTALQLTVAEASVYLWSNGETRQTIMTSHEGTYWCRVTNEYGCSAIDTINTFIIPGPDFTLGNDSIICNTQLVIDITSAGDSFLWSDHSLLPRFVITGPGTYHVQVKKNGCIKSDTVSYSFKSLPVPVLGNDAQLCPGDDLILDAGIVNGTLVWSDGSGARFKKVNIPGTYTVTAFNECGSSSDEIIIKPGGCTVSIPNAFTPRKNHNNVFRVAQNRFLKEFQLKIYNRWGQQIFASRDSSKGWDGTFSGSLQPAGTYVYTINYTDPLSGELVVRKGTVILIQ